MKETVDEFLHVDQDRERSKYPSGFWFIQLFNDRKYEWFLRYIKGYVGIYTNPPLIFGSAIHKAKEYFYTYDGDYEGAVEVLEVYLKEREGEFASPKAFTDCLTKGPVMFTTWANTWAEKDKLDFKLIEAEMRLRPQMSNGFKMNVKLDAVVTKISNGMSYIMETKTTGYSVDIAYQSVELQDQATCYLWAIRKERPDLQVIGVLPDIMYKRQSVCRADRPGVVTRSDRELKNFELELIGLFQDMTNRYKKYKAGYPAALLYPHNGAAVSKFGTDYPRIYRAALPPEGQAPEGYKLDPWILSGAMDEYIKEWERCAKTVEV